MLQASSLQHATFRPTSGAGIVISELEAHRQDRMGPRARRVSAWGRGPAGDGRRLETGLR
jgi:hypothetical protein